MNDTNPTVAEQHDEFCNRLWDVHCRLCTRTATASQESLEADGWLLTPKGEFCLDCAKSDIVRYLLGWDGFLERNMAANVEDANQWMSEYKATVPDAPQQDTSPTICPF